MIALGRAARARRPGRPGPACRSASRRLSLGRRLSAASPRRPSACRSSTHCSTISRSVVGQAAAVDERAVCAGWRTTAACAARATTSAIVLGLGGGLLVGEQRERARRCPGRWHSTQCFCRIGATCSAKVTGVAGFASSARVIRQPSTGVSGDARPPCRRARRRAPPSDRVASAPGALPPRRYWSSMRPR